MAETPKSFFPDTAIGWVPAGSDGFVTDVQTGFGGREQRRGRYTTPYRRFTAPSSALSRTDRYLMKQFLRARKGRLEAFYYWNPFPEQYNDVSVGTMTASRYLIIPYRTSGMKGGATTIGSISDVRLAGVSQTAHTIRRLIPRLGTYAAIRAYGGSEKVDCGSSATLRATGDQSFTFWVHPTSAAALQYILSNETGNASGISIHIDTSRRIVFRTNQAGANTTATSTGTLTLDTWSHVAVVRSGTGVTFYINGVAAGTGTTTAPIVATVSFKIGEASTSINGMVSDVRAYSAALSAGEVTNIYGGNASPSANLKGWWQLTEGTGTTATDSSGYGNTGTLSSASLWVGGEDEIDFGSNVSGAVTVWGQMRERIVCRSDVDAVAYQAFVSGNDLEVIQLAVKEVF